MHWKPLFQDIYSHRPFANCLFLVETCGSHYNLYFFMWKRIFIFISCLGPKANFLQLVSAHVIVAHSKNRLCDGLLEKFNSLFAYFLLSRNYPPRIDEENNFPLLFFSSNIFCLLMCKWHHFLLYAWTPSLIWNFSPVKPYFQCLKSIELIHFTSLLKFTFLLRPFLRHLI